MDAVPSRIAVAYLIIGSGLLIDQIPPDRACKGRGQQRVAVDAALVGQVELHVVDLFEAGDQVESEQPGGADPMNEAPWECT